MKPKVKWTCTIMICKVKQTLKVVSSVHNAACKNYPRLQTGVNSRDQVYCNNYLDTYQCGRSNTKWCMY